MNDNNNFDNFFNTDDHTKITSTINKENETKASEASETSHSEYSFPQYTAPEVKTSRRKERTGAKLGAGVLIGALVLGTAAGFGGSALFSSLNSKSQLSAQVAEAEAPSQQGSQMEGSEEKGFPFNTELPDSDTQNETPQEGQDNQNGFGGRMQGDRPQFGGPGENAEGGFPGQQQEAPEENTEEAPEEEKGDSISDIFGKKDESSTKKSTDEELSLHLSTKSNGEELTTEQIAAVTKDAVVEITTDYVQTGNFMQQYVASGAGSGVIVSEDGYIITNNHVIEDATQITVTLTDGSSYPAELVGRDDNLDVALLKIDTTGLTVASFGDSDALNLGEKVVAIGNPLGQLGGSVSEGIISSLNRDITIDGKAMSLLQTDAAINPGNSGGGLFNDQGQLIGLVVAKSTGEDIDGIGFAIPINDVQAILNDLLNYGYTTGRTWLGVSLLDISNEQMARMYRVSETGTYIYSVEEGDAADKAGLQSGDRIISIDGEEITSVDQVKSIIQAHEVGDTMTFVISRGGQQQTIEVTAGEYVPAAMPTQIQR